MITLAKKKSFSDWVKVDETELKIDYPTNKQEKILQEIMIDNSLSESVKQLKYARLYLKYTIKDWKLDEKCLVAKDELDDELWDALTADSVQTLTLFGAIFNELQFNEKDKKKS